MIGFAEVSDILWRERELLDVLLFKLETEKLLLDAGELRWLSRSTREIELVLEQLRLAEMNRAVEVAALATQLGLPADSNLAALADCRAVAVGRVVPGPPNGLSLADSANRCDSGGQSRLVGRRVRRAPRPRSSGWALPSLLAMRFRGSCHEHAVHRYRRHLHPAADRADDARRGSGPVRASRGAGH